MDIPLVDLRVQHEELHDEIQEAFLKAMERADFVLGTEVEAFEEEFADYCDVKHCITVGSGLDALTLTMRGFGIGPDDEVITQANTFIATALAIKHAGAIPILIDHDPEIYTLDPRRLTAAITARTKAIVPVHLYGHACDMDAIFAVAETHGLTVIEDCAQAHGAKYKGRACGTFGAAAAFSFYPSKNLGAYGDGGAVVTNSAGLDERLLMLRNYGEETRYHHVCQGFNSRLDELQAAVLSVKLPHLDAWNDLRRAHAKHYRDVFEGLPLRLPSEAEWATHCYHLYVIRSPQRDALREHLQAEGIGTQLHYPVPVHLQEAYAFLDKGPGSFPQSEQAASEVLSFPMYPELTSEEIVQIGRAVEDFFS